MSTKFNLTIAIPAYKRPKELGECVESIVNQNGFKSGNTFKVLVIDDSPEGEGRIPMKKFVKRFPKRVRYIWNKKNLGTEKNILKLIAKARTTYILFITDDDKLKRGSLKRIHRIIDLNDPGLIVSSYLNVYPNGSTKIDSLFKNNFIVGKSDLAIKAKIFMDSHILSGKILKRCEFKLKGYKRHIDSQYPHMHSVGLSLLKSSTYYSSDPFVIHRVGNKVYWSYKDDYMVVGQLKIINDLSSVNATFSELARGELMRGFAYILFINILKPKKMYVLLKIITGSSDLLRRPSDWLNIFKGGVDIILDKLSFLI